MIIYAIKNETKVVLRLLSNMVGNSDDDTNFPRKLLVTNRQVSNLRKAFANYLSTGLSTIYQLSIIKNLVI